MGHRVFGFWFYRPKLNSKDKKTSAYAPLTVPGAIALLMVEVAVFVIVLNSWGNVGENVGKLGGKSEIVGKSSNGTGKTEKNPLDFVTWPHFSYDDPGSGLVGTIYRHQHPRVCKDKKYLVWRFPLGKRDARNIGALYSTLQVWLAYSMKTDRILVFDDRNWKLTDQRCQFRSTLCYFRPISSCYPPLYPRSQKDFRKASEITEADDDIQVITFEGAWWPMGATNPFKINVTTASGESKMVTALAKPKASTYWSVAALQYLWRPSEDLTHKINRDLEILKLSEKVVPEKTIAMPVRASDKCFGHKVAYSASGEEKCITLDTYMERAEDVRKQHPEVDTIIFTSESPKMVENSKAYGKDGRWKFVYNTIDVMPGTGSTNEDTLKGFNTRSKGIESALTSLHMQLRAKYFIVPYSPRRQRPYSSWLHSIANLARSADLTFVPETVIVDVHRGKYFTSQDNDTEFAELNKPRVVLK
eukprot:CAMPEP_0167762342 /NCGR_PEP_ID=MMETSP0110_2-20121227/12710_1 /TAXON_ID=629695 /ORGANISM="Gymnochlora sp., Strain CCMP2014" /LENGTH=472 /DNA_ID=CAMNT_0007649197 /DNA_START=110 /DNA_END=1528 /DNA_ORIENTATION=-